MNDIMKIDKSLNEFGFSNKKTLAKQLKIKQKNKKEDLSVCYQVYLGASLLGNFLTGKGAFRAGEGTITAGQKI